MTKLLVEILGRQVDINKIENSVLRKLLIENIKNINDNSLSWLHKSYSEDGYYLEHNAHNETTHGYLAMSSQSDGHSEYTDQVVRKRLVSSDEYFRNYHKYTEYSETRDDSGSFSREGMGYCED